MTGNDGMEKTLDLVRKLLAKASDASVTEAEAASYAAKAAAILAERGLSMADVPEAAREDGIVQEIYEGSYLTDAWRRLLAQALSKLYFCGLIGRTIYAKTPDGSYKYDRHGRPVPKKAYLVVGRPANAATVKMMCEYLFKTTVRLGRNYSRELGGITDQDRWTFERACGERLTTRVLTMWRDLQTQTPVAGTNSGNLPALYATEADLVKNYVEANLDTRPTRVQINVGYGEHADAGRAAGDRVSLSAQLAGGSGALRLGRS